MKVSLAWLNEFIELPTQDPVELAHALDMLGHKVEGFERLEPDWRDVVVGEVLEITEHPDADKIRVCQVDVGEGATQIICGAWNFETGAKVPVARPGAVLVGGALIGEKTIRGVQSNGMICSERELGLGADHAGILVLEDDPELGTPLTSLVELPDVVFELEITTNRPDALSILGIARDLGAWYRVDHQVPPMELVTVPGSTAIQIEVEDRIGCRRFTAREIRGVTVRPAPLRVRHRLHKVGVRAISNVVDVTNYVMLELGHPLHAFDADTIEGDLLVVRRASEGETLVTLDHEERALRETDLIIYDATGPTSMSGTMGGARSEVSETTSTVLMEAASWDPPTIMSMWRHHDLRSEAATRFERGVDPALADVANQRASEMVRRLAGGEVLEGSVDVVALEIEPARIELDITEVERLLGPGFPLEEVVPILARLGMSVEGKGPIRVTVPTFRPDVTRPADLIEEIARIHGFDQFEPTLPIGPVGGLTAEQARQRRLVSALTGLGLSQAINLPFVGVADLNAFGMPTDGSDLLTVKNPLREQESKLRPSLLPGLLNSLRYNQSHGNTSVGLFELGKVFFTDPDQDDPRLPKQVDRLGWAVVGSVGISDIEDQARQADGAYSLAVMRHLARVLGIEVELAATTTSGMHPGRTATVSVRGHGIGFAGELSPLVASEFEIDGRVAVGEIDLDPILEPTEPALATLPSTFPHVDFDLSFLIEESITSRALVETTAAAGQDLVESARVFDEFRSGELGEGQRAVAIRYRLRSGDRTLNAAEIGSVRQAMITAAGSLGARLRGE